MEKHQFRKVADVSASFSILFSPESITQPTLSSAVKSLFSSSPSPGFAPHPRCPPISSTPSPPVPAPPPLFSLLLSRARMRCACGSSLGLRLESQHPLALATLLLVGGPVPLLALGAAVARHLAAAADVELPELLTRRGTRSCTARGFCSSCFARWEKIAIHAELCKKASRLRTLLSMSEQGG